MDYESLFVLDQERTLAFSSHFTNPFSELQKEKFTVKSIFAAPPRKLACQQ